MKYAAILLLLLTACTQVQVDTPTIEQAEAQIEPIVKEAIEEVEEEIVPPSYTIVAFGDSLTAGPGVAENETYPAQLQQLLQEEGYNATVINAGMNGEASAGTLARIEEVLAHNPDIVIVETGVNDILRGIPPATTANNINTIIDELQAKNVTVILAGMEAFGEYQGFSFQVQTMYPDIANEQEVLFIPFFLQGVAGIPEHNLPDYVHPNAAGYRIIAEQNVLPAVEEAIEEQ